MKNLFLIAAFVIGGLAGYLVCKYYPNKSELIFSTSTGKSNFLKTKASAFGSADLFVDQAEEYLANFKTTHTANSSISFSIDSVDAAKLLSDPKCSGGLRVYLGVKNIQKPNNITLMFSGVDKFRDNLFYVVNGDNYVVDYTNPCPKDCPPPINQTTGENDRRTIKP